MKFVIILILLTVSSLSWDQVKEFSSSDLNGEITAMAFSQDSNSFIIGTSSGEIRTFSTADSFSLISQ